MLDAGDEKCQLRPMSPGYSLLDTSARADKGWLVVNSLPPWGGCEHPPAGVDSASGGRGQALLPWHQLGARLRRGGSS